MAHARTPGGDGFIYLRGQNKQIVWRTKKAIVQITYT